MNFLKKLFTGKRLNGEKLALSENKQDYAQIELLAQFMDARPPHTHQEQQRWNRVLPQPYDETIALFEKQGWLVTAHQPENQTANPDESANKTVSYQIGDDAQIYVTIYQERLDKARAAIMPKVRQALEERDTGEALTLRRNYEAHFPLGEADWTGPEPQLSHSALTRRILYLEHPLLEGLSHQTAGWLKLYAAEQHMWGAFWQLDPADIPDYVQSETELVTPDLDGESMSIIDVVYWRAYQLSLYVDNQETWQRCKGGDHVRRLEIVGPDDAYTCQQCRPILGKEYLVSRAPALPPEGCTSPRGCCCRYEPVLETYTED
ncbi:MAG: hypothetical protein AAF639_14095 [Chloroflexota bacterium]